MFKYLICVCVCILIGRMGHSLATEIHSDMHINSIIKTGIDRKATCLGFSLSLSKTINLFPLAVDSFVCVCVFEGHTQQTAQYDRRMFRLSICISSIVYYHNLCVVAKKS